MSVKVSVIVPVFNRETLITEMLKSVQAQSLEDWECIVVDDHSDDNTLKVVEAMAAKDSRIKLYSRPSELPKGANACRNYGFEKSIGKYIQWFDSDDAMKVDMLKVKADELDKDPSLDFVASAYDVFDVSSKKNFTIEVNDRGGILKQHLGGKLRMNTASPFWRRSFFFGKSLFNLNIHKSQEWEFHARILIQPVKYKLLTQSLCTVYRNSGGSILDNYRNASKRELQSFYTARSEILSELIKKKMDPAPLIHSLQSGLKISAKAGFRTRMKFLCLTFKVLWHSKNKSIKPFIDYFLFVPTHLFLKKGSYHYQTKTSTYE
jgi:glycosyltransferase involved in cell wall biosynthesis